MAIMENPRKYAHIPSLHVINKQLLAPNNDLEKRFLCLGFQEKLNRRCSGSAHYFPVWRTGMMKAASDALEKTEVSEEDFVSIARSLFCGYDDGSTRFGSFKAHLQRLWRDADADTQIVFLEAIRQGHKDIINGCSKSGSCPVEDIEYAIKTEALGEDDLTQIPNGDRTNFQIAAYDSKQHPFLVSFRESLPIETQAMYDTSHADGRESSEPDANTSDVSAAIQTRSQLATDSLYLGNVGQNHEIADKKTSEPGPSSFDPGVEVTNNSLDHQLFGSASQTRSFEATKSRSDKIFTFNVEGLDFKLQPSPIVVATSPKPGALENTGFTFRHFNPVAKDSASMKGPDLAVNSLKSFENVEFFTPAPRRPPHDGPSSLPPLFAVTSEEVRIKDDQEQNTPDSMMSGFISGHNKPAQTSVEYTPTRPAKKTRRIAEKSPEMRHGAFQELRHQESPSPTPPTFNPTTSDQISAHDEEPTVTATPPARLGVSRPDYTPRSETQTPRKPSAIALAIKDILREPIDNSNKGYIYVLRAPRFFKDFPPSRDRAKPEQWVKIGITRNMEERKKSLSARCGIRDLTDCDGVLEEPMPMPLLRRVERLCHEELDNFRRPLDCNETDTGCDTVHKEWFNVTEEVAIRTVKRWLSFISQSPYSRHGNLQSEWEDMVYEGAYLKTDRNEDLDRTDQRYQSWLDNGIQQLETNAAEERLKKLSVG